MNQPCPGWIQQARLQSERRPGIGRLGISARALSLLCLGLLSLGFLEGCGGPATAGGPTPPERPVATSTPASVDSGTASTAKPLATPKPTPDPNLVTLEVAGPSGSRLKAGKALLKIPGKLRLEPDAEFVLAGRINLNALSQALKIPSSARDRLQGNSTGVWVEVTGACSLKGSTSKAPIKLRLGESELILLLETGAVELTDPEGRATLQLALK